MSDSRDDYVLDGSPEAVAIVREARGLPPLSAEIDALLEDLDTMAMHVEQAREAVAEGHPDALRAALDDLASVANRCAR